ncbi:MAG: hypothetical protein JJU11_13905 [Candidatus Sumerlaeia bacterium]|nr:hypothetical protein [Candidatus Sumerlaeia bacterium]
MVNDKAPLLPIVLFLLALVLTPLHIVAAQPERHQLPGYARSLKWVEEEKTLVASMALNGVSFLKIEKGKVVASGHRKEWATLDSVHIEGNRYLLAGRFNELRLVEINTIKGSSALQLRSIKTWPVEAIATNLVWDGEILYVASGGAGVQSYSWDGSETEPVLRGRYPYVDYSKELAVSSTLNALFLADNHDTGLQILDIADPTRLRQLLENRGDYVDSLALHGERLAVARRYSGVQVFNVSKPEFPVTITEIPVSTRAMESDPSVSQIRFSPTGALLICENDRGARLIELVETSSGVVPDLLWELPGSAGSAGSAAFLDGGRIALCALDGTISIFKPDISPRQ